MHHYVTNMWCEQYIECITSLKLEKRMVTYEKLKIIYISHHLKTITNYYLAGVFYTLKNFPTYPNIGRARLFQNVITRSCHIYKFTGKIKSQLFFWKNANIFTNMWCE